jgi:hypothetical protein
MNTVSTVGELRRLIATMPDDWPCIGSIDGGEVAAPDLPAENRQAYFNEDSLPENITTEQIAHMPSDCLVIEVTF